MTNPIHVFDSFADADRFVIAQHLAMTPAQRIELCCRISLNGWKLQHPNESIRSLKTEVRFEVRSLKAS